MAGQGAKVDVVLMDPPRSGSTEEFMNSVAQIGPERIVYVSCNPETLVRDLKPFAPTTRWQGMMSEISLCPTAPPTACADMCVRPYFSASFRASVP